MIRRACADEDSPSGRTSEGGSATPEVPGGLESGGDVSVVLSLELDGGVDADEVDGHVGKTGGWKAGEC